MRPPGHLTSSEYAAHRGVAKSRVSNYVSRGMPYVDGEDDHGRVCKFIDPKTADWWCDQNLGVKVDGATGRVRGISQNNAPEAPGSADPQGNAGPGHVGRRPSVRHPPKRSSAPAASASGSGRAGGAEDDLLAQRQDASARIQAAKISQEEDKALTARLRRMQVQGKLLDRQAFGDIFEDFVGKVAVSIDRMPQDMATKVAAQLGLEEHPVYLALRDVIAERMRSDLAAYAEQQRDRLPAREEPPEDDPAEADLFGEDDEAGF